MVSTYHVILVQLHSRPGGGGGGRGLCLSSKRQNFSEYFGVTTPVIIIHVLYIRVHSTVCRFCLVPDHVSSIAENVHIS